MDSIHHQQRVIACARQIMDVPEQDESGETSSTSLIWFGLVHAAVLLYLAFHVLK